MSEQQPRPESSQSANPYSIAKPALPVEQTRPDVQPPIEMMKRRRQYLPTLYGMWWMATLVFFLLACGLGAYHALEYFGIDPFSLTLNDLGKKYVFLSLSGSLLGSLFLIWVLQNTAMGMTSKKPDPVSSYNNVYGAMVCLLIIGSMKLTSDVAARTADLQSGGNISWLRANAYGAPIQEAKATGATAMTDEGAESVADSKPETQSIASTSPSGRRLPQAQPERRATRSATHSEVRLGDPSKAMMATAIRSFQGVAGRVRLADQRVNQTPQPDLVTVSSAKPIEAVAEAHFEAFKAHREMAKLAGQLGETTRQSMLEAGASAERTEEQVGSLTKLLALNSAATIHKAEAAVHGARAAYAGFLAENFGGWAAENGTVSFTDAENGKTAVKLQASIGQRELELKATKYDATGG